MPSTRLAALMLFLLTGLLACSHNPKSPKMSPFQDQAKIQEQVYKTQGYQTPGNAKDNVEQYRAMLRQNGQSQQTLTALGNMAVQSKDWKKAEKYYKQALDEDPEDAALSNNLATVYISQGKYLKKARRIVEKALPTSGALAPYLLNTLANIHMHEGHTAEAQQALAMAESKATNDPELQHQLAESRQKLQAINPR